MIISSWLIVKMRNVSDENCVQYQNTFFVQKGVFGKSCRLWGNVEKYDRGRQITDGGRILHIRTACCITKVTDIPNIYCFSTVTIVTRTLLDITLQYIACLLFVISTGFVQERTLNVLQRARKNDCDLFGV